MSKLFVSVSQLAKFKKCPRQWSLEKARGLRPIREERSEAQSMGTALHAGLEAFHRGDGSDEVLKAFQVALEAEKRLLVIDEQLLEGVDPLDLHVGRALLRAYMAYEPYRMDEAIGVISHSEVGFPNNPEEEALLTLGNVGTVPVVFCGRYDGYDAGREVVVEHKTVSSLSYIEPSDLVLDEQVSGMCWAASKLYNKRIGTVLYNILVKPRIKFQSRGNSTETYEQYEFRLFNHIISEPTRFFDRLRVERTPEFLADWRRSALDTAKHMIGGVDWPVLSASWGGPCRRCNFSQLCRVWHNQEMVDSLIRLGYTTPEQRAAAAKEKYEQNAG